MRIFNCDNYETFSQMLNQYEKEKTSDETSVKSLILLFVASDDPDKAESWCSDCRNSKPVIDKIVQEFEFNEQLELAVIQVGQRDDWLKEDNPFRLHKLRVSAVPTLISLKNVSLFLYHLLSKSLVSQFTNNSIEFKPCRIRVR